MDAATAPSRRVIFCFFWVVARQNGSLAHFNSIIRLSNLKVCVLNYMYMPEHHGWIRQGSLTQRHIQWYICQLSIMSQRVPFKRFCFGVAECVPILFSLSYLRCSCALPHFGGQELRLQEASVCGAHTLPVQTRRRCLGDGEYMVPSSAQTWQMSWAFLQCSVFTPYS